MFRLRCSVVIEGGPVAERVPGMYYYRCVYGARCSVVGPYL